MLDYLAAHKNVILLASFVLAFLLLAAQYLSNAASEYKSQKDQEKLLDDNKKAEKQIEQLTDQNVKLLGKISILENKTELLNEIGKTQLQATFYTEELDQKVQSMSVKIRFEKQIKYAELLPYHFMIILMFEKPNAQRVERVFYIQDGGLRKAGGDNPIPASYKISRYLRSNKEKIDSLIFSNSQVFINEISVPIVWENHETMKIKDFHDQAVIFHLPDSILKLAKSVEFVINDWVVLDKRTETAVWVPQVVVWPPIGKINDLKRSALADPSKGIPYSLWTTNLFKGIPKKYTGFNK